MFSHRSPHRAEQKQGNQLEPTYSSFVRIRDVALMTNQKRWTIGRSGERGSRISVLVALQDDDDDIYIYNVGSTEDVVYKTYQEQSMIEKNCVKVSGKSALTVWLNDDEDDDDIYIYIYIYIYICVCVCSYKQISLMCLHRQNIKILSPGLEHE